jgi:low affinity Fe/Cu permease
MSPRYLECNRTLTNAGSWLSRPEPVVVVGAYTALWLIFDRESFNWQAIASIATLLMTLFIQRSEHRDTQAIRAKLDELLRTHGDSKKNLTTLDDKEPEQIEAFRWRGGASPLGPIAPSIAGAYAYDQTAVAYQRRSTSAGAYDWQ